MLLWITCTIIVLVFYGISKLILWAIERTTSDKPVTRSTSLSTFSASHGIDAAIGAGTSTITESISQRYERMCFHEIAKYQGSSELPEVLDQYRKLLHGEILDPMGEHIPSELLENDPNPDYETYLKAQKKVLKARGYDISWIQRELSRIKNVKKEDKVQKEYCMHIISLGIPAVALPFVMTDYRMENYSPDQWRDLADQFKKYMREYEVQVIGTFLLHIEDPKSFADSEKMARFSMLYEEGVPIKIAIDNVMDRLCDEAMAHLIQLVQVWNYSWDEAYNEVSTIVDTSETKQDLRAKYRSAITSTKKLLA